MKTIIYCRKSTDDSTKQQQSLWTQLEWCENYATSNNIDVVDTIVVSESAKDVWKEWFKKLMNQIEGGGADSIICMYFDRLSRNPRDSAWTQELLQKWKILRIITSTRIFTIEDSWLLFSVESWFANEYILKIKKWVRDGFKKKMQDGWYYSQAPIWYLNNKITGDIDLDIERAPYIKKIFELRTEWFSVNAIREITYQAWLRSKAVKNKGGKVATKQIEDILKNTFYYWWITYNWEMFEKWEIYKWKHTPIITKELFDKVQQITRWVKYVNDKELSYLKWKVFHYETQTPLCTFLLKKQYTYFHLHSRQWKLWYNQSEIIKYFDENIQNYRIPEVFKKDIKEALYEEYNWEFEQNTQMISILKRKSSEKENILNWLLRMRASNEISWEEFIKIKNDLTQEIEWFKIEISKLSQKNEQILIDFNKMVELLFCSIDNWKSYDDKKKTYLLSLILVELKIDNQKRLYIVEKPLFKALNILNSALWSKLVNEVRTEIMNYEWHIKIVKV